MHLTIPIFAIVATAAFLGLSARRYGMISRHCWLWFVLSSLFLTIVAFVLIEPLTNRLVTLYWRDVPLNKDLDSIELSFTACIWYVVTVFISAICAQFMRSELAIPQSTPLIYVEPWISTGFFIILLAFLSFQFAQTHASNVDLFEHLRRPLNASTITQGTYYTILGIAAIGSVAGVILIIRGYFHLIKKCSVENETESS